MPSDGERINKILALRLGLARREADELITAGRVTVDGKPAALGQRVTDASKIAVDGKTLGGSPDYVYLAFHKPAGYVCSRRRQGDTPTIYELLPDKYHSLKPVGRLDKDSSGLIILSNDGGFAHRMTHPTFQKVKIYEVVLDMPLQPLHRQMISEFGVMLEDGKSKFLIETIEEGTDLSSADLTPLERQRTTQEAEEAIRGIRQFPLYRITMHEGRNRQIRRTFSALDYTVTRLHRTTFGPYTLGDLKPGEFKEFSA